MVSFDDMCRNMLLQTAGRLASAASMCMYACTLQVHVHHPLLVQARPHFAS